MCSRIKESQNFKGWKGPQVIIRSNPKPAGRGTTGHSSFQRSRCLLAYDWILIPSQVFLFPTLTKKKKETRVNFGLTFYVGLDLKYLEINWSPAYHLQREAEVWDTSEIKTVYDFLGNNRFFFVFFLCFFFLDGRGSLQHRTHPEGTAPGGFRPRGQAEGTVPREVVA